MSRKVTEKKYPKTALDTLNTKAIIETNRTG